MKRISAVLALCAAIGGAALAQPAAAGAAPTGGSDAASTVKALQDMGYAVQINGSVTAPLSACGVTGVHGTREDAHDPGRFDTAYVDVTCPMDS